MLLFPWSSCACAILVQSRPPGAPQGDLVKKLKIPIICLIGLIIVLFCKIHDLVVHQFFCILHLCQFGPAKMSWGPRRVHSLKSPPLPHCSQQQKLFSANRMHLRDLKWCVKKISSFWCHFEVSILTRFGIFCRLSYLCTYTPYYWLDWNLHCVLLL